LRQAGGREQGAEGRGAEGQGRIIFFLLLNS